MVSNEKEEETLLFKKKREDELKEQYLNWEIDPVEVRKKMKEWGYAEDLIEMLVGIWSGKKLDKWIGELKKCKTTREVKKLRKILEENAQRMNGLREEDYYIHHDINKRIENMKSKLQEWEGLEKEWGKL